MQAQSGNASRSVLFCDDFFAITILKSVSLGWFDSRCIHKRGYINSINNQQAFAHQERRLVGYAGLESVAISVFICSCSETLSEIFLQNPSDFWAAASAPVFSPSACLMKA